MHSFWNDLLRLVIIACASERQTSFGENRDTLLNVSASAFDALPADSFVCRWKAANNLLTHHDDPQIPQMSHMDAQRLQDGCPDTVVHREMPSRSLKVTAHKITSCCPCAAVSLAFFCLFFYIYRVWILCLDVLTIKLMVVNLRSYGSDLWSNKNDQWYGQNPVISQKKSWAESFHSRRKQKAGGFYCACFLISPLSFLSPRWWF